MVAVMGSGCSPATEPTAEIDHYYNLTHVRPVDVDRTCNNWSFGKYVNLYISTCYVFVLLKP